MLANIFSWLYSLQAGRTLSKEEFGVLAVFLAMQSMLSVPAGALATTVSRYTAFYSGKGEVQKHFYFFRQFWWLAWALGLLFFFGFLFMRGPIDHFFDIDSPMLMLLFAPILIPTFLLAFERGTLSGQLAFTFVGMLGITEAGVKLLFLFLGRDLPISGLTVAVLSLPLSIFAAWLLSLVIARSFHPVEIEGTQRDYQNKRDDSLKFLGNSIFASLGAVLIYNIDILLVKHFFSPYDAGVYSTLSVLGKMLFFGAGSLISLLIPLTARAEASKANSRKPFLILLSIVLSVGLAVWLSYVLIPHFVIETLLTGRGLVALPYLSKYSLAMLLLVVATCFSSYNLAKKNYLQARMIIFGGIAEGVSISLYHDSLEQVVNAVLFTMVGLVIAVVMSDLLKLTPKSVWNNLASLFDLFRANTIQFSARKKKILIFNWRDTKHLRAGGAEVYINEIASRLVKNNYDVTIFTANDGKNAGYEKMNGLQIIRRGGFVTVYIWAAIYYFFKFRSKFDLIIDSENGIPFFSPVYSRVPVVLLVHHVHRDVFFKSLIPPFSWIANFLEAFLMPLVYRRAKVVAVSDSTARQLAEEVGLETSAIISNGVDTKLYQPSEKSADPVICYVGRLKKYKSVDVLIKSFKQVIAKYPKARLVIAGDGDYRNQLEKIAGDLKLSEKISFLGKITDDEKVNLLGKSWVLVQPSYMEGWGITCIEANSCATPVIASNVPGLREAVADGTSGYLFQYGNSTELAAKLLDILANKKNRLVLSKQSRIWSHKYNWDIQANKFHLLIQQTLEKSDDRKHFSRKPLTQFIPNFDYLNINMRGNLNEQ